jgi:hypothetical protein
MIFFERTQQKYYIRNINEQKEKSLIYVQVLTEYIISKKQYFQLGQVVVYAEPLVNKNISFSIFLPSNSESTKKSIYLFKPEQSPVVIGRTKCSLNIDHPSLSKKHCTVIYNEQEEMWSIVDGNKEKNSTNGTWIWVNSKFELFEKKTIVKIGNYKIKIDVA